MTLPLINSMLPEVDNRFDLFIEEIGLGVLSPEQKEELADTTRTMAVYRITEKIIDRLTPEQQEEMGRLIGEAESTNNFAPVNHFFFNQVPDIDIIIEDSLEEVKSELREATKNVPAVIERQLDKLGFPKEDGTGIVASNQSLDAIRQELDNIPDQPPTAE